MTSTDKTRDKLVASMRKTKAASADKAAEAGKVESTARSKTKTSKPAPTKAKTPVDAPKRRDGGTYQAGRRVWPD